MGHPQPATPMQVDNTTVTTFTTTCNKKDQKPLTCVYIGFAIEQINSSLKYAGLKDNAIMQTIIQNITMQHTIKRCAQNI